MNGSTQYDVIIVGGSYAGLSAAMALGRALRQVLVIDNSNPCNRQTPHSHNFLTNDGKTPAEIAALAREQVSSYKSVTLLNGTVISGQKKGNGFDITLETGETYSARKLVFVTGIKDILPDITGFAECWGISVLHCPYCHGYEVRHQKTGIVANGDAAFELSTLISNWTDDLTLYTNGASNLTVEQTSKLKKHRIEVVEDEIARLGHRNGYVRELVFKTGRILPVTALYVRPPFVQHSEVPRDMGCQLNNDRYIHVDSELRTNVQGIFACGDNINRLRTVSNAVAMGTTVAFSVNRELILEEF